MANQWCHPQSTYVANCSVVPLFSFSSVGGGSTHAYNLTSSYAEVGGVVSALRGFVVGSNASSVVIVDDLVLLDGQLGVAGVVWSASTAANVTLVPGGVDLSFANITTPLQLRSLNTTTCPGLVWRMEVVNLQPPLEPTPGTTRVVLGGPGGAGCTRIAVGVAPAGAPVWSSSTDGWGEAPPVAEWGMGVR